MLRAFSPLFVGAMVATGVKPIKEINGWAFQSPFRRGSNERLANAIESLTA